MQVAGGSRVEQQNPRHVAVVLLAQLHDVVVACEHTLVHEVQGVHLQDMGVDLIDGLVGVLHPLAVGVGHEGADLVPVGIGVTVGQQGLRQVDELDGLLGHMFRAFAAHCVDGGINGSAKRCTLGGMNHFIHRHDRLLSFSFSVFMALFYAFSRHCVHRQKPGSVQFKARKPRRYGQNQTFRLNCHTKPAAVFAAWQ